MGDELAMALFEVACTYTGLNVRAWRTLNAGQRKTYQLIARAAQEFYGLTGSAEKGAVGKVAAHLLRRTRGCGESATCAACIDREMCDDYQCLIALGVEVPGA